MDGVGGGGAPPHPLPLPEADVADGLAARPGAEHPVRVQLDTCGQSAQKRRHEFLIRPTNI